MWIKTSVGRLVVISLSIFFVSGLGCAQKNLADESVSDAKAIEQPIAQPQEIKVEILLKNEKKAATEVDSTKALEQAPLSLSPDGLPAACSSLSAAQVGCMPGSEGYPGSAIGGDYGYGYGFPYPYGQLQYAPYNYYSPWDYIEVRDHDHDHDHHDRNHNDQDEEDSEDEI